MKLPLVFLYVALLNIGVTPIALAKPTSNHTHLDQAEAAPLILKAPRSLLTQAPPPPEAGKEQVAQITAVQLKPTPRGLEVILETTGTFDEVLTSSSGNSLITDIPNAQLRLPKGREFRQDNPTDAITAVRVENLDAKTIRVTVTGKAGIPEAEVLQNPQALILSLTSLPAPVAPPAFPAPTPQPPLAPTQPPATEPIKKPEVKTEEKERLELGLTAEQEAEGYSVPDATTATKIPLPLRDIPQSIQVIPRQVIEDRQVVQLTELADNVSGVQPERGYGGIPSPGFRVRGFLTNFETLRNGFPDYGYFSPRDVANVERFEVLKGPGAVLYGGSPTQYSGGSGVINTVTKQPLEESYHNANMTIGSYEFYRPTIDISGPLTSDSSLLYRLNAAYENAGSFRDFVGNESFFIAPVLAWNISPQTALTVELNYQSYDFTFDQGFPIEPEVLDLPRSRYLGEPDFSNGDVDSTWLSYNFTHEFNDNWRFRQGFNFTRSNLNDAEQPYPIELEEDRRTALVQFYFSDEFSENLTLQNEIFGRFSTGPIRHNVLLGADLARNEFNYLFGPIRELSIDIFAP